MTLSKKQLRTIDFALDRFYGTNSFIVPKSIDDFKGISNVLQRELKLKENRIALMTDLGLEYLKSIASTIHDAGLFGDLANYSDLWGVCRDTLLELLSEGLQPDHAQEFIDLISLRMNRYIEQVTFAVPVFGIELGGIPTLQLGSMKIAPATIKQLETEMVEHSHANVEKTIEITKANLWLIGSARGTPTVAKEKFQAEAELAVGMLAIAAASMFENGATAFRIGIVMSPEQAYGRAAWMSWTEEKRELTTHYKFADSQNFKIDSKLLGQFKEAAVFDKAFTLLQSKDETPLEEAITRAVYWYSDAHREKIPVMKLIKYWSCVETFFSAENNNIAKSVSAGLACLISFGSFQFVHPDNYRAVKKRITKLYGLRSRALHGALHRHVSSQDAADLSQWIAWMLINMIAFIDLGYTDAEQIKKICIRLDARESSNN